MANRLELLALAVLASSLGCNSSTNRTATATAKPAATLVSAPPQPPTSSFPVSGYVPAVVKPSPLVTPAPVVSATLAPVVSAAAPPPPSFAFDVDVPSWTNGAVYVACDAPVNGTAWSPNALALTPDPQLQGRWTGTMTVTSGTIAVTSGTVVNFKVTRGSWNTVEKGPQGDDVPNRVSVCGKGPTTVSAHVFHWGDDAIYPAAGAIRELGLFTPRAAKLRRAVFAHLPTGYDDPANAGKHYPVLYALDGQCVFDPLRSLSGKVLGLDKAADGNITAGHAAFITVAIDSTFQRVDEYGPSYDPTVPGGGHLENTASFLLDELKPEIDRIYRTNPDAGSTAVLGTELGGLAAFRMAWVHADRIGLVAALSPLMGWNGEETRIYVAATTPRPALKVWLDVGTNEGANPVAQLGFVRNAEQALLGINFSLGRDLAYSEVAGGTADEAAWGARLPQVLGYLFP